MRSVPFLSPYGKLITIAQQYFNYLIALCILILVDVEYNWRALARKMTTSTNFGRSIVLLGVNFALAVDNCKFTIIENTALFHAVTALGSLLIIMSINRFQRFTEGNSDYFTFYK